MDRAQVRAFVDRFVLCNWRMLAAAAWRGYRRCGRGAVTITWHALQRWVDGEAGVVAPPYSTRIECPDVAAMVRDYDPASAIVAVFLPLLDVGSPDAIAIRTETVVGAGIFSHAPPPAQAEQEH